MSRFSALPALPALPALDVIKDQQSTYQDSLEKQARDRQRKYGQYAIVTGQEGVTSSQDLLTWELGEYGSISDKLSGMFDVYRNWGNTMKTRTTDSIAAYGWNQNKVNYENTINNIQKSAAQRGISSPATEQMIRDAGVTLAEQNTQTRYGAEEQKMKGQQEFINAGIDLGKSAYERGEGVRSAYEGLQIARRDLIGAQQFGSNIEGSIRTTAADRNKQYEQNQWQDEQDQKQREWQQEQDRLYREWQSGENDRNRDNNKPPATVTNTYNYPKGDSFLDQDDGSEWWNK